MSRLKIAAGNWKMNKTYDEGVDLAKSLVAHTNPNGSNLIILGVPYIHLKTVSEVIAAAPHIKLAAQNCHEKANGAYTGEISALMLTSVGAEYVILGHSERRQYFREDNFKLEKKVKTAIENGLKPIYCCGESLEIRDKNRHHSHVATQIKEGLFYLSKEDFAKVVIAYEPIWAIGTGQTATPEQAQDMHYHIREQIADYYDNKTADATSILYGGSVKPANAKELFAKRDVDGGLVGGASLKSDDFAAIYNAF